MSFRASERQNSSWRPVVDQPLVQTGHLGDVPVDDADVVGDQDDGDAFLLVQAVEKAVEMALGFRIDARRRLVEKQDPGLVDDGPGDEDALLLAAGQAADPPVVELLHADDLRVQRGSAVPSFLARREKVRMSGGPWPRPLGRRPEKAGRNASLSGGYSRSVRQSVNSSEALAQDQDSALGRLQQAEDDLEQRRFSRPVRTDDGQEIAGVDRQGDVEEDGRDR